MLVITVHFEIKPGYEKKFAEVVLAQAQNSLSREPECHVFDVCCALEAPATYFLYEQYTNTAAFDAHLASEHFKAFDAAVGSWVESKAVQRWLVAEQPE